MNYKDIRSQIKTGDVIAWGPKNSNTLSGLAGHIVRIGTRSEYSHIGIAFVIGERVLVLESMRAGVRLFPLSLDIPFYWIPVYKYWNDGLTEAAFSKFGQKYSIWDGVKSIFQKITPGADNRWECAEFVQWLLQLGKHDISVKNLPTDIIKWLQENKSSPVYFVK